MENSIVTLIRLKSMHMPPHLGSFVFSFFFLFYFVCNHLEAVAECVSTSCPSKTYTVPRWILQPGALLFAIRVVLVLAVLTQWLCG